MNEKNRIHGMEICIILIMLSALILMFVPNLREIALFLIMFVAGYGLRDTLDSKEESE